MFGCSLIAQFSVSVALEPSKKRIIISLKSLKVMHASESCDASDQLRFWG